MSLAIALMLNVGAILKALLSIRQLISEVFPVSLKDTIEVLCCSTTFESHTEQLKVHSFCKGVIFVENLSLSLGCQESSYI